MNLSNQYYIHIEDGRNYVKLHKFHIQANKELLGANYIKLHKFKLLQVISSYEWASWATNFTKIEIIWVIMKWFYFQHKFGTSRIFHLNFWVESTFYHHILPLSLILPVLFRTGQLRNFCLYSILFLVLLQTLCLLVCNY